MKLIHSSPHLHQISHLHQILGKLGIESQVRNADLIGARGEVPFDVWPELWVVEPDDYAKAEAYVHEYNNPTNVPDDWTCPGCGESLEGQFDTCWSCGEGRPE